MSLVKNKIIYVLIFSMGRHKDIDSFYLCQPYTRIPKHLVHDNSNILIVFKQDELNFKHIYSDHVESDMTFDDFYTKCWKDKYGFLLINKGGVIENALMLLLWFS